MKQYHINTWYDINVTRTEEHFDKACSFARRLACITFDIDDDGYPNRVIEYTGRDYTLRLEFVGYSLDVGMCGETHTYKFKAMIHVNDEEN